MGIFVTHMYSSLFPLKNKNKQFRKKRLDTGINGLFSVLSFLQITSDLHSTKTDVTLTLSAPTRFMQQKLQVGGREL